MGERKRRSGEIVVLCWRVGEIFLRNGNFDSQKIFA